MKLHETLREQRRGVEHRAEYTKDHLGHEKRKGVLVGGNTGESRFREKQGRETVKTSFV